MLITNSKFLLLNTRFFFSKVLSQRNFTTFGCLTQSFNFTKLNSKSVIQISGAESTDFLQGLLTNDVRHLTPDESTSVNLPCIYSFILNNSGRIIADLFVYKFSQNDDLILLEVDEQICSNLAKLLKLYRVRRKIKINLNEEFRPWVVFPDVSENIQNNQAIVDDWNTKTIISHDPRNYHFGYRIISTQTITKSNLEDLLKKSNENLSDIKLVEVDENRYRSFRYQYGIGEGPIDLPPESAFPLEANGDILNGISFHKGCYVGQELTTRTYHTGVIRKRIMPIKILTTSLNENLENLSPQNVINNQGRTMGRFRANFHHQGLAVLKFSGLTNETLVKLSLSGLRIRTWQPFWWPESIVEQSCKLDRMTEKESW